MFLGTQFVAKKINFCLFGQGKINEGQGNVRKSQGTSFSKLAMRSGTGCTEQ